MFYQLFAALRHVDPAKLRGSNDTNNRPWTVAFQVPLASVKDTEMELHLFLNGSPYLCRAKERRTQEGHSGRR